MTCNKIVDLVSLWILCIADCTRMQEMNLLLKLFWGVVQAPWRQGQALPVWRFVLFSRPLFGRLATGLYLINDNVFVRVPLVLSSCIVFMRQQDKEVKQKDGGHKFQSFLHQELFVLDVA